VSALRDTSLNTKIVSEYLKDGFDESVLKLGLVVVLNLDL